MAEAQLTAVVGANIQNFVSGMEAGARSAQGFNKAVTNIDDSIGGLQNKIKSLEAQRLGETDIVRIGQLNKAIATAEAGVQRFTNIGKQGFDEFGESIQKATAKTGGFISGANDAYGAVRKLAFILPGIGIAGIFNLAFEGIAAAFSSANKEIDATVKKLEEYNKTVSEVVSNNTKESATVDILVGKIQSGTLSRQQTVQAIKELQKIAPDYFSKLNAEKASIEDVTRAYGAYNNQIVKTIEAQIRIAEITDLVKQRLTESAQLPDAAKFIADLQAQGKTLEEINAIVVKGVGDDIRAQAQLAQSSKGVTDEQSKQLLLQSKVPAGVQTILSLLQKERDLLKEISGTDISSLVKLDKVKLPKEEDLKIKFNNVKFPLDLEVGDISIDTTKGLDKKIDKTFLGQIQDQLVASLGSGPTKEFQRSIDNFRKGIANDVIGLGEGIFEDLGNAFAGTKNPFANILDLLGGFVEDFGKQLLVIGGLSQLIQDLLPSVFTPAGAATAIVVGALAIAAGAALKSLSSKKGVTAFAEGGIVTGPTNALIGEAGPEVVFPLDKLNRFIRGNTGSNQNINVNVTGRASGRDLLFIHDKQVAYRKLAT